MNRREKESGAETFFGATPEDFGNPQRSVLLLRWLVIIATSYLVLFSGELPNPAATGLLLLGFILSNVVLGFFPPRWFFRNLTLTLIVLLDSLIVSGTLLLSPGIEGDIFILYFFVILLAAAGGSFTGILVASVFVPGLYLVAIGATQGLERMLRTEVLLRVPFIFCVCIFYGFLSERARRERQRAETAELSAIAKTQLFSTLTHDVRNGLGTIVGFSEILLEDAGDTLPPRVRETLQQIKITSLHSAQLISNLLDAARIEGGQLRVLSGPLRLGELLVQVAERYEAQAS
ncbi:MAG: sensor histidine kinase, partial [Candidatus Binatia bacterium]